MFPSALFSNKTSLYAHWNLPLALKFLKAGPAANLAAPLPPQPQFPCTNSCFSLPCARAAGSAPRCGSTGSVLLSWASNPIHLQQGNRGKTQREPLQGHMQAGSELARCDPARIQQPQNRSGAAQTTHRSHRAGTVHSRLMSSGTAPSWMGSFQIGLESWPSSRSWAGWMHTEVSLQGLGACRHSSADTTLSTNSAPKERWGKEQKTAMHAFYKLICKGIYTLLQINPQLPCFSTLVLQKVQV